MIYIEYVFSGIDEATAEILMALLSEKSFDTFDIQPNELLAYIAEEKVIPENIPDFIINLNTRFQFVWQYKIYESKNWNEEWEKNFDPIIVSNTCLIRAPFHSPQPEFPFELIIEPRMSFGTGHHASTYLMISAMLQINFTDKQVADAGCGTGILAIFAAKCGAKNIFAVDNNEWAYANALDNIALNNTTNFITLEAGELELLKYKKFDIILANINKNIIKENMLLFKSCLAEKGLLVISGILITDIDDVLATAKQEGFYLVHSETKDDWICAQLAIHNP